MKNFNLSRNYEGSLAAIFGIGKVGMFNTWAFKRFVLNFAWAACNFGVFIFVYKLVANTIYEYIFIALGVAYCLMYWIIATALFDKLIGDEIDNLD